jgi:tetratricopeptide (TPR) repeat protein
MPRFRAVALAAVLALAPAAALAQHQHHGGSPAAASDSVPLFDNLGSYSKPISTRVPAAQRYFDQGVRLLYGFNHMEAMLAFREAARLDPACAICWWGVATSYGPDINQDINQDRWRAAASAIATAQQLSHAAAPWERDYVAAATRRFIPLPNFGDTADVRRVRKRQDTVYAGEMRVLTERYPDDPDAATWYAESLLDLAPWNQWSQDGRQPRPGTMEALRSLRRVLDSERWRDHPGANHFYIHAVEASSEPGSALPSADRLRTAMPGASHMVHMPSHVYLRMGQYHEAAMANVRAVKADTAYLRTRRALGRYPRYFAHNLEFLWSAAGMSGERALSLGAAHDQSGEWPADSARTWPNTQHFLVTPWVVMVRFGMWDRMRSVPAPPADLKFARGAWHYARGFADLRTGRRAEAEQHFRELVRIINISGTDSVPSQSINSGRELLRLAAFTLEGEIHAARGNGSAAINALEVAVDVQDHLRYDEPPPFYFPARHSLGAVLLQFGRAADAERVYRTDLGEFDGGAVIPNRNRLNGWSLKGLELALQRQGKPTGEVAARFREAWRYSDVTINSSRF